MCRVKNPSSKGACRLRPVERATDHSCRLVQHKIDTLSLEVAHVHAIEVSRTVTRRLPE